MNTEITDIKNESGWVCLGAQCSLGTHLARRFGRFPKRHRFALVPLQIPALSKFSSAGILGSISALVPAVLAIGLGRALPGWVWMWLIAVALFFGAKWLTILRFVRAGTGASPARLLAYAFLWPGMDARAFCAKKLVPLPRAREWAGAAAKAILGAVLVWFGVHLAHATNPIVTGWIGMIGLVLLLHFGLFHMLSLIWRALGIDARPIMRSPATATSLGRFWGGGWNAAFSDLMHGNVFKVLTGNLGPQHALLLVFLISGILHELVISVPARGGYGLPTTYFALQGLALLLEHSKPGRRLRLGSGWTGWCFVALVAGGPVFWLLHPVFIHNVILPMLHAIGAT